MSGFSLARRERLLVERLGDEVVVYDQDADVAHCLAPSVAAVWEHADGTRDVAALAAATGLSDTEVDDALVQLRTVGLIEEPTVYGGEDGHTRREATKRIARVGALAAAAPLIYTLAISPAAAMASGNVCSQQHCGSADADVTAAQTGANSVCITQTDGACTTCFITSIDYNDPAPGVVNVSGYCGP
jgi:hypothetical protein